MRQRPSEEKRILAWRWEQFERLLRIYGMDPEDAKGAGKRLAQSSSEFETAKKMLERGCSTKQLMQILT